ncbi:unnamed protein product, partial [Onchocerca flexuosa]|uniref:PRELI/MSF1 domain-containing protein n=1 Tax=Onchocerca flexuosa TaxID=387005 RepID=A0A183HNJ4_9BILA
HRYPNTTAKHVISEDLIEVAVDGDQIKTKKLILKQTGTFLKAVPRWMSCLTNVRVVPTIEESIFDRSKRSLVTYTRNITMLSICKIHERCVYKPGFKNGMPETVVERAGFVSTSFGKLNAIIERVLMTNFKKSMRKTVVAYMEKLTKRLLFIMFFLCYAWIIMSNTRALKFGEPALANHRTNEPHLLRQKIGHR